MSRHTELLTDSTLARLRDAAQRAAGHSYSPYSRFPVGAAVLGANGKVYSGCNVENASFGLTQCAERAALTAAIADGAAAGSLQALLIYTPGNTAHPPCGACRQVMRELMAAAGTVASCCDTTELKCWSHAEHLPDPFLPEDLPEAARATKAHKS
jgi:cytidine deaminase